MHLENRWRPGGKTWILLAGGLASAGVLAVLVTWFRATPPDSTVPFLSQRSPARSVPPLAHAAATAEPPAPETQEQRNVRMGAEVGADLVVLLKSLQQGRYDTTARDAIVAKGREIPLAFIASNERLLRQIDPRQKAMKDEMLGLLIAVGAEALPQMSLDEQAAFFESAWLIADHELASAELIEFTVPPGVPKERVQTLIHRNDLVVDGDRYFMSTVTTKLLALNLVSLDPDTARKAEYVGELPAKLINTQPATVAALRQVARAR